MSEIERVFGTNSRNVSVARTHGVDPGTALEVPDFGPNETHVSRFDPDLVHDESLIGGFTWIAMERHDPAPRGAVRTGKPHLGWSLLIATVANVFLGVIAISTGATLVGVVACSALSIATCLLVVAEIACRYGIDPVGRRAPRIEDRYLDDRQRDDR